jgi:tRNA dimethylallyltransferase
MSKRTTPVSHPVALIAGPTASGKSDLSVALGQALLAAGRKAVIINADSAQVYADLAVLSARPSAAQMQGVPHRLFGSWDGATACSAPAWAAAARAEIAAAHAAGAVPILVGGTGLYMSTLLDGIAPVPVIDPAIRAQVRALPLAEAYAQLQALDPDRAAALAPADSQRICRSLEVVLSTGRSLLAWQDVRTGGIADQITLTPLVLLPEREALFARCDARFGAMLDSGAVAEVERLLARQLDPALPVMRAIGVPEIAAMLRGACSREEALAQGQQATRNYAKRQYTWFRNQPPAEWPRIAPENVSIDAIFEILF